MQLMSLSVGNLTNKDVFPVMKAFDFRKLFLAAHPAFAEFVRLYDAGEDPDRLRVIVAGMFLRR